MDITDRFTIRNKFLFFTGFLIFTATAWYSAAKSDNSGLVIFLIFFGGVIMYLGVRKPKEKADI